MLKLHANRLLKLADFLEALKPKELYFSEWVNAEFDDDKAKVKLKPNCGTAACAAGWATVVFPRQLFLRVLDNIAAPRLRADPQVKPYPAICVFFGLDYDYLADDICLEFQHIFGSENKRTPKQEACVIREFVKKKFPDLSITQKK